MSKSKFRGWFSDVGFTCRVLMIADELEEWAETWGAKPDSPMMQAIAEVRETGILEMERWQEIGWTGGYLSTNENTGSEEV